MQSWAYPMLTPITLTRIRAAIRTGTGMALTSYSFDANTQVVSRNSGSQTLGQNSEITINGDNNNVKVTQCQAGSQDINSPSTTTIHDPRTHFYTPQQKRSRL